MEYTWKGAYRGGEIQIRSESLQEIEEQVNAIVKHDGALALDLPQSGQIEIPKLEGITGCSAAVRAALGSPWGREPRSMAELQHIFELNAVFFSLGTLSGVLNYLTRSGEVRRLERAGRWAYTLAG